MSPPPPPAAATQLRAACANFFAAFDPDLRHVGEVLAARGTYRRVPKGELLLRSGQTAEAFYFMHRGVVRNYVDGGRNGSTTWLTLDANFVTAMASMTSGEPSLESIETLEETELLAFAAADLQRAYREVPGAERLGRLVVEHYFRAMTSRLYHNALMSARERYVELLESSPEIIARVPLSIIAGYLQMTPETLSRTRAQLARGET